MTYFQQIIEEELTNQRNKLRKAEAVLKKSPEGFLALKPRKNQDALYQVCTQRGNKKYACITDDKKLLKALIDKRLYSKECASAKENIKYLEPLVHTYTPNDLSELIEDIGDPYKYAIQILGKNLNCNLEDDYDRCPFDPQRHVHETTSGILVRSKSEVIIANALTSYGIPFRYEERFPYPDDNGNWFYPDFTFHLPTDEIIIWEHFGLLSALNYSLHCGEKLSLYQKYGYTLYKNLIITVDDVRGNCSSALTDQIIRRELLPFYR